MNHEEVRQSLDAYHDGELSGAARREVEAHLSACPECRRSLADWRKAAAVLFRPPEVSASEPFVRAVMDRVKTEVPAGADARWGDLWARLRLAASPPRLALAGAAVAAALLLLVHPVHRGTLPAAEMDYVADLMEGPYAEADNGESRLGTTIEEYFL